MSSPPLGISAPATVSESPALYPEPGVVTVTPVTVLPSITNVKIAPDPLPLEVVLRLVSPALLVASVGLAAILANNAFAVVTNPLPPSPWP